MTEQYKETQSPPQQVHPPEVEVYRDDTAFALEYIAKLFTAYMNKPQIKAEFLRHVSPDIFSMPTFTCNSYLSNGNTTFWFYFNVIGKNAKDLRLCKNPIDVRNNMVIASEEGIFLETVSLPLNDRQCTRSSIDYDNENITEDIELPNDECRGHVERLYDEFASFRPTFARPRYE